mmetsp:Transcript_35258/g.26299  ORF Transcript_35258/g.26299 Transcript_35258/m.26299 type:complete len:82 (-) Transcript_35258:277-522(-)
MVEQPLAEEMKHFNDEAFQEEDEEEEEVLQEEDLPEVPFSFKRFSTMKPSVVKPIKKFKTFYGELGAVPESPIGERGQAAA